MKIPFLKPGTYIDQKGKAVKIEKEDLQRIIDATRNFSYQDNSFPLVIGHPETDTPAWGWVSKDSIRNENNILAAMAEDEKLNPEFVKWFNQKLYKNVSVKLRPDYSIAHIGFLGAKAPAVTGLPSVAFSKDEEGTTIEFSDYETPGWWSRALGSTLRGIKNFIIESKGVDTAEKIIPESYLEELAIPVRMREIITPKDQAVSNFSENNNSNKNLTEAEMNELEQLKQENAALKADKTNLETQVNTFKTEATTAKTQLSAAQRKEKENQYLQFCESDAVKLKIKPAEKKTAIEVLLTLDTMQPVEFAEGDEQKKVSPVQFVQELIKRLPDVVQLGEFAKGNKADAGNLSDDLKIGQSIADKVNPK